MVGESILLKIYVLHKAKMQYITWLTLTYFMAFIGPNVTLGARDTPLHGMNIFFFTTRGL